MVNTKNARQSEFTLPPKDVPAIYDVVFGGVLDPPGSFGDRQRIASRARVYKQGFPRR